MCPIIIDHRPKTFDEVIGNKHLISILRSMAERERKSPGKISRAILLHGKSGCGKTTLARLFAKEVGCSDCNIIEVDVSDNRGIDAVREIKRGARYKPIIGGEKKAYILDEFQGATGDAMAAMLKILEEPPSHVFFLLCTTAPEKLLETIKNRCKKLKVKPLADRQMERLIVEIAKKENIQLSGNIIGKIVSSAEGCPRQALDTLDTIRELEEKDIEKAISDFSISAPSEIINLCRAMIKGEKWGIVRKLLEEIKDVDVENVRRQVLGYLTASIKNSDNPSKQMIIAADSFRENFFSNGKAGLVLACYEAINL